MSSCKAQYKLFDRSGKYLGGGDIFLPEQLDWMSIDVKAHWFRVMGQGPSETRHALLISQGEQRLITNISLSPLDHKTYKERLESSHAEVDKYIEEGGYSRVPRNQ